MTILIKLERGQPVAVAADGTIKVVLTYGEGELLFRLPQTEAIPTEELNQRIDTLKNKTSLFVR